MAIAQSLIVKPKILLMDEPYGALDPFTREAMQILLLSIWEETKMTIVFVTHDLEEAVYIGSRVICLSQYYRDDRNEGMKIGARVVSDFNLGREIKSPAVKSAPEFGKIIGKLVADGMRPEYLQLASEFRGNHPDSFMTLEDAHDTVIK